MDLLDRFQAFSPDQLLTAADVIRVMRKNNLSGEEFLKAVDAAVENKRRQVKADAIVRPKPGNPRLARKKKPDQHASRQYPETLACPKCGQTAYAQQICPNCAKGRAGIRREYICGECNFVFYLD